ncbi:MAG TPA: phosphoglycerate kinase [Gemmatimonadaceae bacterium]|nr:phosphoglycerate kinase [Gemmatimonadaceae bacterium]
MLKKTIRDLRDADLRGKRALVRVDFNVPLDAHGGVADDTRIRAALPTIRALLERHARVVLLSHLGRPKGRPDPKYSLEPVSRRLSELLPDVRVCFVESTDTDEAMKATHGACPVLLLENTRFLGGEETNDERLSRALAQLGDVYVNDAFGSAHRAHASTEGVAHYLHPAVAGLLMEKELEFLGAAIGDPQRPYVAVLGGAKISGKIDVIQHLLPKVDRMIIGGAMACTFFKAMGLETGRSLVEADRVDMARDILAHAGDKLVLPSDACVTPALEAASQAHSVPRAAIPPDQSMFDIGSASAADFARIIRGARTVVWNGPMGVFETPPFDAGTKAVALAMVDATKSGATTVVGGGDSAAAIAELGLEDKVSHVSTGGGASLEFLEGRTLPGVAALEDRASPGRHE